MRDNSNAAFASDNAVADRQGLGLHTEAEQALLDGLGPLAESLASHHQGHLVRWGAWLESAYLTVAEARKTVPPPDAVKAPRTAWLCSRR